MPPDDSDYNVPAGFDLDGSWSQDETNLSDIASEQGWDDWRDVIAGQSTIDWDDVRPGEYMSAAEALRDAYERGILDFTEIWYDGEVWHLVVGDSIGAE